MKGNRIWVLVTLVVIAAVLGLGWLFAVSPLLTQAQAAELQRQEAELTNAAQAAALAQMKEQFAQLDELELDLEALQLSVPSDVDSDYVYALLSTYQAETGATASLVTLGDAVQFGIPVAEEVTTATPSGPSGPTATGRLASDLYTVPVTITFDATPLDSVLAFVNRLQHGPRLFLVTSVTTSNQASTITAYMFVIYDATQSPEVQEETQPTPLPTATPTATPTPGETGEPTPTPTPTP